MNKYTFPQSSLSQNFSTKTEKDVSSIRPKSRISNISTTGSSIVRSINNEIHPKIDPNRLNPSSFSINKEKSIESTDVLSLLKPSPSDREINKPLIGLQNLGNTCYMNAVLQCMCRLSVIKKHLKSFETASVNRSSRARGRLLASFYELAKALNNATSNAPIYPREIRRAIAEIDPQYLGYQQHDCAEYFRKLIEGLHEETNRISGKIAYEEMKGNGRENTAKIAERWWKYSLSRENSIITDFFLGQYLSVISCHCGHKEISCDTFLDITLTLPTTLSYECSLQECFQLYCSDNKIPEYKCQGCKEIGKCYSKLNFFRMPKVLVIQLKRFVISFGRSGKLNTDVNFPDVLDLKEFCISDGNKFRLNGVCHHTGSLSFGHYFAECFDDSRWYTFDDETVVAADHIKKSNTAYLLFYVLVDN